jgi:hypothetical protein
MYDVGGNRGPGEKLIINRPSEERAGNRTRGLMAVVRSLDPQNRHRWPCTSVPWADPGGAPPIQPKVPFFRPKKKSAIFYVCPPVARNTYKKALGHCTKPKMFSRKKRRGILFPDARKTHIISSCIFKLFGGRPPPCVALFIG